MPTSTAPLPVAITHQSFPESQESQTYTLRCVLQNRLGGLDRVLGALTHRGLLPVNFHAMVQDEATLVVTAQLSLSADSQGEKSAEKLTKFLQKQVYVLTAELLETPLTRPMEIPRTPVLTPHFV